MPGRSKAPTSAQPSLFSVEEYLKTAPCVPLLRQRTREWRDADYPDATDATRQLLRWWFQTDHRLPDGRRFAYHASQREAMETLIYVYEVANVRTRRDLIEQYARHSGELRLPPDDDFARYCVKMATGSGKTKVMSLAIAWHFANAVQGGGDRDYARTFLILAPNVIVLERLKTDFAGGRIFQTDPVLPRSLRAMGWEMDYLMRGERERADTEGLLLLTNIQQLYDRPDGKDDDEPDAISAVLGGPVTGNGNGSDPQGDFAAIIARRGGSLLVINDEAHHTHDEDSEWTNVIRRLHDATPIACQLDFSATPRFQKGQLFPWTISDYPLKQAIVDGVVKRPYKGVADIPEAASDIASVRYKGFLTAAVHRWREYRDSLAPVGKRPLLFVMLNSTQDADEVGDFLRTTYPEDLGGDKTLTIHTKRDGEITGKDLDTARRVAREVDQPNCPVNAIVSVLMLREGWDVQNVTVVVGLRPYSAKANILPEQTIGRGLRLMFRDQGVGYTERVDIIGNRAFLEFVEDLERLEEIELGKFEVGKDKLVILTIQPVAEKAAYDIALPRLSPVLQRKTSLRQEIEALDVASLACSPLPRRPGDDAEKRFRYEGYDFITAQREIEREYTIPTPQSAGEIIGYHARIIAKDLKLPSQFAALAPKVRDFFAVRAFGGPVDLDDMEIVRAMSTPLALFLAKRVFGDALRKRLIEPLEPTLLDGDARRLAEVTPFPFSRVTSVVEGRHCILNYAPCENEFERDFGKFLDGAGDVARWCKLPDSFGFAIEYTDQSVSLRYYYPDFVVVDDDGVHWLVETKGAETLEVAHKDQAATLWCENATDLTGMQWRYRKVPQKDFKDLTPVAFSDLSLL
ncbi:MAG: DEAD/DEAH box helicase family protein [Ktedonobacterales bacterium]